MYNDRKHHNYLMLQLRRLRESGATTIDTNNHSLLAAVQEARQFLEGDYSQLTGKERYFADKDAELARWALSMAIHSTTDGHAVQRARTDNANRPEPVINEDLTEPVFPEPDATDLEEIIGSMSQEECLSIMQPEEALEESSATRPIMQEPFWKRLSKHDLRSALHKTEEADKKMKDTITNVSLSSLPSQYGYPLPTIYQDWTDLMRALESNGLAISLDKWGVRLTEQGKAWLNEGW